MTCAAAVSGGWWRRRVVVAAVVVAVVDGWCVVVVALLVICFDLTILQREHALSFVCSLAAAPQVAHAASISRETYTLLAEASFAESMSNSFLIIRAAGGARRCERIEIVNRFRIGPVAGRL